MLYRLGNILQPGGPKQPGYSSGTSIKKDGSPSPARTSALSLVESIVLLRSPDPISSRININFCSKHMSTGFNENVPAQILGNIFLKYIGIKKFIMSSNHRSGKYFKLWKIMIWILEIITLIMKYN